MKYLFSLFLIFFFSKTYSQTVTGKVMAEGVPVSQVTVINMNTDAKTTTDAGGNFTLTATQGDEIRWVKAGFDRVAKKITGENYLSPILIELRKNVIEIPEVTISSDRQKVENLKNSIGLPKAPENAREKAPELKRDILLPLIFASVNLDAIYKVASGDARRMKRAYAYDDLQSNIRKIRSALTDEYFISAGIPSEKINEFIHFGFSSNPEILQAVRVNNITKAILKFDALLPIYLNRLKNSGKNLNSN